MAQVTGGSDFDDVWEDKIEASTLILQEFSDLVVANSEKQNSADQIIPAILKIFSMRYGLWANPRRRSLREWQALTKSARQELKNLKPKATELELDSVESQLRKLGTDAIESWREGDPEFPKTTSVLNDMVRILFKCKFIKNPPRPEEQATNA